MLLHKILFFFLSAMMTATVSTAPTCQNHTSIPAKLSPTALPSASAIKTVLSARAGPQPPTLLPSASIINTVLSAHNAARSLHGLQPMTWSSSAAQFAANNLQSCKFRHTPGLTGFGENIAINSNNNITYMILNQWYDEIAHYNYDTADGSLPSNFYNVGHFTQMVWRDTLQVGCAALANCPFYDANGNPLPWLPGTFLKCNYYVPGNMIGSFDVAHIPRPISGQTALF